MKHLPDASTDQLKIALLRAVIKLGGIATAEDLRSDLKYQFDVSTISYDTYHTTVSNALINLADAALIRRPFGHMSGGDRTGRRNWLVEHRPQQEIQQVWQITSEGKEWFKRLESRVLLQAEEVTERKEQAPGKGLQLSLDTATTSIPMLIEAAIEAKAVSYTQKGIFDPSSITDARNRIVGSIVRRQGQPEFRRQLLKIYSGRCAITGSDAEQALEAAHIIPYNGLGTNHPSNGLLLRADIHTLFDLHLIAIEASTMTVTLSAHLLSSAYRELDGKKLRLPAAEDGGPVPTVFHLSISEFFQYQSTYRKFH